ncbi:ranBP-type and C3HC4-type zinc finger-containing protein 1-like isoform X1 [Crassostrea angulata]|nr:ranBP-type and C3HC4-type zinc finger-containing protein 1-like isoform X1 [Crassostrea angulata]
MSQFIPDSQSLGLSAPEQVRVNGKEILCVTTCEIYIPLPDVDRMSQGTLERARRAQRLLHPHSGLCDLYLLCSPLSAKRRSVAMDCDDSQYSIKLSLILNNIIKDTLRVFQKGDSWFEFWSLLGDKKHNSTVKLCREDDRWKEFSTQLTKVINDLRECIKTQNIPNQVFELAAFQSKKSNCPQKAEEHKSEPGVAQKRIDRISDSDLDKKQKENKNLLRTQSLLENSKNHHQESETETGEGIGLSDDVNEDTRESCDSPFNAERQTEPHVFEPPFSPANFQLIDTNSNFFGKHHVQPNVTELQSEDFQKTIRLKNNTETARFLCKHVPSPKSIYKESENEESLVEEDFSGSDSDYEDMMEQEKAMQRLVELLQAAINSNDKEAAAKHAGSLAVTAAKVTITLDPGSLKNIKDTEFSIKVYVEDREASGGCITLNVKPSETVKDLKLRMCLKHSFPVEVQKWIIGKRIPPDSETLQKARVTPGQAVYLYLISPKSVGLTKEKFMEDRLKMLHNQYPVVQKQGPSNFAESGPYIPMGTPVTPKTPLSTQPPSRQRSEPYSGSSTGGGGITPKVRPTVVTQPSLEEFEVIPANPVFKDPSQPKNNKQTTSIQTGWVCPACTYINQPTRPGCEICATNRPLNYQVPDGYKMTREEEERIRREREQEEQTQRLEREREEQAMRARQENFEILRRAEDTSLIANTHIFKCPICLDDISPGNGVILRECLHSFCKDCLQGAVVHNEEAELRCPYQDNDYACNASLQDREIKALVEVSVYEKHLQRSLVTAESQERNSFHCKTNDCPGWCIYEDLVNFFSCPVCKKENCLTCKAIHEGMNCKEYQEDLRIRSSNDKAAKQTNKMLKELLKKGDAMKCPKCEVVVQKKDGCDWIKCSICKTEICWVTKGPRWGPLGVGDISGGCRCRVEGKPCHENCNNCH